MWFEKDVGGRASRLMFLYYSFARTDALVDTFGFSVYQNAFFPLFILQGYGRSKRSRKI